jgi:carbamoyltransferase
MAAILGISAHYHDSAAALVIDGEVVAAMSEERISRIKNDPALPRLAARRCLKLGGITAADLDAVVFYESPFSRLERVLVYGLRHFPRSLRQLPRALEVNLSSKLWVLDLIAADLGIDRSRVRFVGHHDSHAASAFFPSPFPDAAILTVDGVGEDTTTAIWHGQGDRLTLKRSLGFPHSLGLLYAGLTGYLGFPVNEGEYRVMGLAAWGRPTRQDEFAQLIHQEPDGAFSLSTGFFGDMLDLERGFGPRLEALLGPARRLGRPWDLRDPADQAYADIAATLQHVTEEALLRLARQARTLTGSENLCLAGGVALNCVANARLAAESGFRRVFVQPAAGDAGGALGAALLGAIGEGERRCAPMTHARLGDRCDPAEAAALAGALGMPTRRCSDPAGEAAARIGRGQIIALVSGRLEWGPRALGQRSILAHPADAAVADTLNRIVKRREPFRPFAPAILEERTGDFFVGGPDLLTPFMTTTRPVRDDVRLDAIRHVDGSARLQTVTPASAPALAAVLTRLQSEAGLPVALNTSLNGPGEPIVASAADAVAFFRTRPIDAMLIGDLLLSREPAQERA